jgi:hypothetical protein
MAAAPKVLDTGVVRFEDGAGAPSGCIGVSRRTGAVACVVGQYAGASDDGSRRLTLLGAESDVPDLPLHVTGPALTLEHESRVALDQLMRDGEFVTLGPPVMVPVDSKATFGQLEVRFGNDTPDTDRAGRVIRVVVRSLVIPDPHPQWKSSAGVLLYDMLEDVACITPTLAVRSLDPDHVLLERICELADGGVVAGAWLCDGARANCE